MREESFYKSKVSTSFRSEKTGSLGDSRYREGVVVIEKIPRDFKIRERQEVYEMKGGNARQMIPFILLRSGDPLKVVGAMILTRQGAYMIGLGSDSDASYQL